MQPQTPETEDPRRVLIRQLFAANRGQKCDEPTMEAYLHALRKMDTARLARVVERILDGMQYGDTEPYRVPQPGTIWRVAKEIQHGRIPSTHVAAPPLTLEGGEARALDGWDINANLHLLNYVTLGLVDKSIHGVAPRRDASRYAPPAHTAILAKWKRAWAADMRDDRAEGGKRDGKALWADYMARAEAEIDQRIGTEARAA